MTGVFTIPLARMGPLCRSIDLDPAMLVQASKDFKVALWQGVEVADDLWKRII